MGSFWNTLLFSFLIVVGLGVIFFIGKLFRKIVCALRKRRSRNVELATLSSSPTGAVRRAPRGRTSRRAVTRGSIADAAFNSPVRSSLPHARPGSMMCSSSTRQGALNHSHSTHTDTSTNPLRRPTIHDDAPPSYESVMGYVTLDLLPPPYSSLQGTNNIISCLDAEGIVQQPSISSRPHFEDNEPLAESQEPPQMLQGYVTLDLLPPPYSSLQGTNNNASCMDAEGIVHQPSISSRPHFEDNEPLAESQELPQTLQVDLQ